MSSVSIKLEGFAGGHIETVLADACEVARRCGCWATMDINGIHVLISPDDRPSVLWANYQAAQDHGAKFVSANVVPPAPRKPALATPDGGEEGR